MTTGSNMRMENLFFSLKELQNEKVCVEQKLHEVKLKRHSLEQEIDHVANKCFTTHEKHRRMSEILAVARQKVDQTMATMLSLQADIEQSRPKLDELQNAIETQKKLQIRNMEEFEGSLLNISSQLFTSRDFYKSSNLQNEINNTQKTLMELEQQVVRESKDVQRSARCLEKLTQCDQSSHVSKYGIEETLFACYRVMERDETEAKDYLHLIQAELNEIHDILRCVE